MSFESYSSSIEEWNRKTGKIEFDVFLNGNTNVTLLKSSTSVTDVVSYVEINATQPSTGGSGLLYLQDSDANFPTLDSNADPTVWSLLALVKDADDKFLPTCEVIEQPSGVTTTVSRRGGGTDGVTSNKNLSFSFSSAGLDLDSAVTDYRFRLRITYKKLGG